MPLFWAALAVGVLGLVAPGAAGARRRPINLPVAFGLALVVAAVLVQLWPLDAQTLGRLGPATDRLLRQYVVGYPGVVPAHPLSIRPDATLYGLAALVAFGVLLLGIARGLGHHSLRTLAAGVVFVGFALAIAGIVQSGLSGRGLASTSIYGLVPITDASPFGPFINRNHFAGWMLMALPLALGYFTGLVARGMRGVGPTLRERVLWFSSPDASRVILVGLAILVMGLSLVLTFSRSGIGGFALALALAGFFVVRRQAQGSRRAVVLSYVVVLLALSLGWAGIDAIVARFAQLPGTGLNGRLGVWADAWRVVRDFTWTGTGLNTFSDAMVFYQTFEMTTHTMEAHNDYLQLLADGGLLVGVPALIAILLLAREIRRRFRERADEAMTYWLRVGATTGLVAIAVQEAVEFGLRIPGHGVLLAVIVAIAIRRGDDAESVGRASLARRSAEAAKAARQSMGVTA
ncbi:MAG TPA: O-antigen ligase family protein [Vicinamibacterales bacterium]|nr:O-antigen ligase family protein [Vicinamibacterales bacterium]